MILINMNHKKHLIFFTMLCLFPVLAGCNALREDETATPASSNHQATSTATTLSSGGVLDQGYLALPSTEEQAPAILVLPSWWGLNDFFKEFCDRLAQAGFVVFAPDLYGGKVAETQAQAAAYRDEITWQTTAHLHPIVQALRDHPQVIDQPIGVIGFSLGSFMALSLAEETPQEIGAVVIFYGTRPGRYQGLEAAIQGHFAEADEFESQRAVNTLERTLTASGVNTTFYTYPGTAHWFFESNQPDAYQADAAQLAWERTLEFLKAQL